MSLKLKSFILGIGAVIALQGCVPAVIVGGSAVAGKVISDPRTVGTQIDDEAIEAKVNNAINQDAQLKQEARINAVSYNAEVLLIGQVPTESLKLQAGNIAKGVRQVKRVYNELIVGPRIPFGQTVKDASITSQIKSKLLTTPNVSSMNVKVITENAVVYLMGDVLPQQAQIITNVARQVSGVRKVVNAMHFVKN